MPLLSDARGAIASSEAPSVPMDVRLGAMESPHDNALRTYNRDPLNYPGNRRI